MKVHPATSSWRLVCLVLALGVVGPQHATALQLRPSSTTSTAGGGMGPRRAMAPFSRGSTKVCASTYYDVQTDGATTAAADHAASGGAGAGSAVMGNIKGAARDRRDATLEATVTATATTATSTNANTSTGCKQRTRTRTR